MAHSDGNIATLFIQNKEQMKRNIYILLYCLQLGKQHQQYNGNLQRDELLVTHYSLVLEVRVWQIICRPSSVNGREA